jgi:hypothetical protein
MKWGSDSTIPDGFAEGIAETRNPHKEKTRMRLMKPIAATALSFAFLTAGTLAQSQQTTQSATQSTTSTDAYGQTQTSVHHKAKRSSQTTLPDGTTVTSQQKTDATHYDSNGNPVAGQRTTSNSQDTVSPYGNSRTHTETQTHTESNPAPPQPPPAPPQR